MEFASSLVAGRLVKRYKRFLADVILNTGEAITASCPNTGSMMGLTAPDSAVWLSTSDAKTRKYKHRWELVETDLGHGPQLVGINTSMANQIVSEAIEAGGIKELSGYQSLQRERKYGTNSRIDILLNSPGQASCYVEVKSVTLMRNAGVAQFPDAVTARGAKHLAELSAMVASGQRAVMLFLIQRPDADCFEIARDLDSAYGAAFDAARKVGVEMLAYKCTMNSSAITVERAVPFVDCT